MVSSIESYKSARTPPPSSIPSRWSHWSHCTVPLNTEDTETLPEQDTTNPNNTNNDSKYYYCSVRIGDRNISVKILTSTVAYAAVMLGINNASTFRRDIQKVLYKILKDYKFPDSIPLNVNAKGINAVIVERLLDSLLEVDDNSTAYYRILCNTIGGKANGNG